MRLLLFPLLLAGCPNQLTISSVCKDLGCNSITGLIGGVWIDEDGNEYTPVPFLLAGRERVAVGSPGGHGGAGEIGIFPRLRRRMDFDAAPVKMAGLSAGEALGYATVSFTDVRRNSMVALSAPGFRDGAGSVYLLTADTFADGRLDEGQRAILGGPGDFAGATLAGVQGRDDVHLLVGAPRAAERGELAGAVDVYAVQDGRAERLTRWLPAGANATLGAALLSADLNADGLSEAIIGAPGEAGVGRVYAVTDAFGALHDLSTEAVFTDGVVSGGGFGAALAVAEGEDGYGTVAVGAPGGDAGVVYLFAGRALVGTRLTANEATGTVQGQAGDEVGRALAFRKDGTLVVGAPGALGGKGAVYAYKDPRGSLSTTAANRIHAGRRAGEGLGINLGTADLTGDGTGDLSVASLDRSGAATWSILPGSL